MALLALLVLAAGTPAPTAALERDVRALIGIPHLHRAEPVARRQAGRLPLQRDRLAPGLDRVDAGGWPELVTTFDDPVTSVEWSPAGDWLAVQVAPAAA